MNKIIISGNLTRDPGTSTTASGSTLCTFTLAVNRTRRQPGEEPEYFRVTTWGKLAENCAHFLTKGRKALVIGELKLREYTGRDGQTRASLDVHADEVEFIGAPQQQHLPQGNDTNDFTDITPEDIPF